MTEQPALHRSPALHPLLASRWSPTQFDPNSHVSPEEIETLLEAARWAPSAGNSQPWAFIAARRDDDLHTRLMPLLAPSAASWAGTAALLVVNLCHRHVEETDWEYSEFALYDLGQAVAHMTLQAQSLGFSARQFRGFDRDAIAAAFNVPSHWEVTTLTAFGATPRSAEAEHADAVAHPRLRARRALRDLQWPTAALADRQSSGT